MPNSPIKSTCRPDELIVLQWNCRGFRRKRAHLEQYIKIDHLDAIPDVICLQETGVFARLQNYKSYSDLEEDASGKSPKSKPAVTTLVRRNLSAIRRETGVDEAALAHVLIEVIPNRNWGKASTFVLNVYSPPRNTSRFTKLFRKTIEISRGDTLLIVGDFNAHRTEWGYRRDTIKGRNLWLDAHQEGLTLITDPTHPATK